MEYVGDLYSPCLLCEQPKCEFINVNIIRICALIMIRKHFAGNFSASIISNSECKKHSFEALKVVDKPLNVIN